MSKENQTVGQQIDNLLGTLQNQAAEAAAATEAAKTATLRYSTESVEVLIEDVNKTIRQHFEDNSEALGLPSSGNLGVRSEGKPADADNTPEPGRTYTASVSRENKGL